MNPSGNPLTTQPLMNSRTALVNAYVEIKRSGTTGTRSWDPLILAERPNTPTRISTLLEQLIPVTTYTQYRKTSKSHIIIKLLSLYNFSSFVICSLPQYIINTCKLIAQTAQTCIVLLVPTNMPIVFRLANQTVWHENRTSRLKRLMQPVPSQYHGSSWTNISLAHGPLQKHYVYFDFN
jgi:hypothetical protein